MPTEKTKGKTDVFNIDEYLADEQKMMRDVVRKFIDREYKPIIMKCFEDDRFPIEIVPQLVELGLLGIKTSEKYGGSGMDYMTYGLICQELERGDSGLRSFVSVQNLAMYPIEMFGSNEQKDLWLPRLVNGEIGCFGLTEPDHGSNPAGMKTYAKKDGDNYILNGTKMWITNGNIADLAIVWAKTDQNDQTGKSIRGFLVEKDRKGFSAVKMLHKGSLRASETAELILDDVVVPATNMLPGTDIGLKAAFMCLNEARYGIAWGVVGAAINCYECARDYCDSRIQFGKPIASYQLIQAALAEMLTKINYGQLAVWQLAQLMAKDDHHKHLAISMEKLDNSRMALEVALAAVFAMGANGISLEYPPIRHLANLIAVNIYEGTENVHLLTLGRHITGIQAFS
ncbi:MAG: acyl-CoA dehydrogenase family protein [Candidatus Portnoybacteria bacterium]|nr:acyl-CoA dehydrogenase family protein [Candidatus Portnoybacteria bacterium]